MTRALRWLAGAGLAVAVTGGLRALSWIPMGADTAAHAVVRLTWRVRGERVTQCRRLTAEELASLPRHMRREEACDERVAPYRLLVVVDGVPRTDETVRAAGVHEDRPLYVHRDYPLSPGPHRVVVRFERIRDPQGVGPAAPDRGESADPARLALERDIHLRPGEVALVTYDPERRVLVLRGYGGP